MRFFADHGVRNIIASTNATIVNTLLAHGHYPEVDLIERDRLVASGWTQGAPHPTSAAATGAWPPRRRK